MYIMFSKKKYTVYDGIGKVVIISTNKAVCIAYSNSLKGE